MADPRLFDTPAFLVQQDALEQVTRLLADVPAATTPFSERFGNPALLGSPASLVEAAHHDRLVREAHGLAILTGALAKIVASQQERIEKLENAGKGRAGK